jgi:hypothetical protein
MDGGFGYEILFFACGRRFGMEDFRVKDLFLSLWRIRQWF